ncbi:flippase [Haloprofundus halophilus]|nr:flippase [Haloprofundus halophilus]QCJ47425.1 flippase [Haloprofundus sp. MHR1]
MDLGRSSFNMVLSKGGGALLMFAAVTFFARSLDSAQLGIFFLFFAVQGLLSIPADLGLRGALEKRLSEGQNPETVLGSAVAFKLVLLAIVSLAIFAFRPWLNDYLGADLANLLIATVVLRELSLLYIHAVRGELRVGETAPIEFARRLTWVVVAILLITQGFGIRGIVYGLMLGSVVAFTWAYAKCTTSIGRPSIAETKSLFVFSKYDTINSVGAEIYQWMDSAFIGFFLAAQFVSAYEIAWQITLLVIMVSKSISLTLFPQISQWNATASIDRIEETVSTAISFAVFVSIPAIIGSMLYSTEILRYIFGPEYTIASMVLVILMIEKLFQSFNDIVGDSVRAIDRPDLAARATVVSVGINLILNPVLIVSIGFVGAAIATTVSWMVNTVLHTKYLSQYITIDIPYRLVGWYAVMSVVMGGILLGVKSVLPVTGLVLLIAQVGLGTTIYLVASVVVPDVRRQIVLPGLRVIGSQVYWR